MPAAGPAGVRAGPAGPPPGPGSPRRFGSPRWPRSRWGLVTLLELPPKVHVADTIPDSERRHVLIVLDVSPSMRLKDAGPDADQSRMKRASVVMESFLQRVPVELYLLSVVACYNGAKPVVVDTKDLEVVRNIFGDLPMHYAFTAGKTDLFSGLAEAAKIAHPWQPRSTLLLDALRRRHGPRHRDAQDAGVGRRRPDRGRRRPAARARSSTAGCRGRTPRRSARSPPGSAESITTATPSTSAPPPDQMTVIPRKSAFERLTRREYALIACGLGGGMLAFLPVLLHRFGTRWRPGVRSRRQDAAPLAAPDAAWPSGIAAT